MVKSMYFVIWCFDKMGYPECISGRIAGGLKGEGEGQYTGELIIFCVPVFEVFYVEIQASEGAKGQSGFKFNSPLVFLLTIVLKCLKTAPLPIGTSYACTRGSEHPAHGPIGQVWADNVGRFYRMGTKLPSPKSFKLVDNSEE